MNRLLVLLLVIATLFVPGTLRAQELQTADSTVGSFNRIDSVVTVQEDGTVRFEETLDVTFNQERRGIYRYFPVKYTGKLGEKIKLNTKVIQVIQDGKEAETNISEQGKDLSIRIGNASTYISGDHLYSIGYEIQNVVRYFDDYDEIYLNSFRDPGDLELGNLKVEVQLPNNAPVKQYACYTGEYGSTNQNCLVDDSRADQGVLIFESEEPFTYAVGFEKGIVHQPTFSEILFGFLLANSWLVVFFIPSLIAYKLWSKYGKDHEIGPIVTKFEPLKGLSAAMHGKIVKNQYSRHITASLVVALAVKGYLKIVIDKGVKKPKSKHLTLVKLKESDNLLIKEEADMLNALFEKKKELRVSEISKHTTASKFVSLNQAIHKEREQLIVDAGSRVGQIFMIFAGFGVLFIAFGIGETFGILPGIVAGFNGLIVCIFGFLMVKKSKNGTRLYAEALGFKDFIDTAEKHKAQWAEKEHLFEDYLPFAVAFEAADHWANVFKELNISNLDWIEGTTNFNALNVLVISNSLTSGMKSTAVSPSSSGGSSWSGSSGSGGGGFSGGGFSGGGGGSW